MAKIEPEVVNKKEVAVDAGCCDSEEERYPTVYFYELPLSVLKNLNVGDDVVVTLKGKIKSVAQREDYSDKEVVKGSLDITYNDITVKSGKKSEWADMVD